MKRRSVCLQSSSGRLGVWTKALCFQRERFCFFLQIFVLWLRETTLSGFQQNLRLSPNTPDPHSGLKTKPGPGGGAAITRQQTACIFNIPPSLFPCWETEAQAANMLHQSNLKTITWQNGCCFFTITIEMFDFMMTTTIFVVLGRWVWLVDGWTVQSAAFLLPHPSCFITVTNNWSWKKFHTYSREMKAPS